MELRSVEAIGRVKSSPKQSSVESANTARRRVGVPSTVLLERADAREPSIVQVGVASTSRQIEITDSVG